MDNANRTAEKWPLGFAINPRGNGPSDAWIEKFRNVPASWVSDSLGRSVGTYGLNCYHGDLSLMMVGLDRIQEL